jgi:hypothetical protein
MTPSSLVEVTQRLHVRVPVEGIGIEVHLGVEHEQVALVGHDQWVDLEEAHVFREHCPVEVPDEGDALLDLVAAEAERECDIAPVVGHVSGRGVDGQGQNLLGRLRGDGLDVHAALGGADEGHPGAGAIHEAGEIELAGDPGALLYIDALDGLALGTRLVGDEGLAQHHLGVLAHLVDGLDHANAAFVAGVGFLEAPFAPAAGMDLGLHHPHRAAEGFRRRDGLLGRECDRAPGHRHLKLAQQQLRLVFVDVHGVTLIWSPFGGRIMSAHESGTTISCAGSLVGNPGRRRPRALTVRPIAGQ